MHEVEREIADHGPKSAGHIGPQAWPVGIRSCHDGEVEIARWGCPARGSRAENVNKHYLWEGGQGLCDARCVHGGIRPRLGRSDNVASQARSSSERGGGPWVEHHV